MPINRDFVDPDELTSQVRTALAEMEVNSPTSLARFLPSETLDDIEYEADAGQGGLIEAAMWRAYDAELPIGLDEELGQMRGRIPSLGQKLPLLEENRLRLRNDSEDALRRKIERMGKRAAEAVAIAVNIKRGEALADGKLTFTGNNQDFVVPFGRRPDFTTTATDLWTDPDADPLAYLESLADLYETENGFRPEEMLAPTAVRNAFYRHPKVNAAAWGKDYNADITRLASASAVDAMLGQYELPTFTSINGKVKVRNNDGTQTVKSLIPGDSLIMLPGGGDPAVAGSSTLGSTFWGVTIEATRSNWGISEFPGIVAAVHDNDDVPARMWVSAIAIAMPVLVNANYSLRAKVI